MVRLLRTLKLGDTHHYNMKMFTDMTSQTVIDFQAKDQPHKSFKVVVPGVYDRDIAQSVWESLVDKFLKEEL